jgi:hypothetical protein
MNEGREARSGDEKPPPRTADLWSVALLVFFVSLIAVVAALLILPRLGA